MLHTNEAFFSPEPFVIRRGLFYFYLSIRWRHRDDSKFPSLAGRGEFFLSAAIKHRWVVEAAQLSAFRSLTNTKRDTIAKPPTEIFPRQARRKNGEIFWRFSVGYNPLWLMRQTNTWKRASFAHNKKKTTPGRSGVRGFCENGVGRLGRLVM